MDFLTGRTQRVRLGFISSSIIVIDIGAPQGCVLSAFLFIIYTNALRTLFPSCRVLKYADDTVIIGLITNDDESEYRSQISHTSDWCNQHNLLLNVNKTKELLFDFRRNRPDPQPILIDNSPVDICKTVKYLGVTFDNELSWSEHISSVVSKCQQRLYFLRLLNTFQISQPILHRFYVSYIQSVMTYNFALWWNSALDKDKAKLIRVCRHARKVVKSELNNLDTMYIDLVRKKSLSIMENVCAKCGTAGHEDLDCDKPARCVNCQGNHTDLSQKLSYMEK